MSWPVRTAALLLACTAGACAPEAAPKAPAPAANPVTQRDWPCFRGQPALTGLAGGELPAAPSLLWSFRTGGPITASPIVVDGRIYIGSEDGVVTALSLAGERVFATPLGELPSRPVIEAPALFVDERLYVGDLDGGLWCLAASTGAVQWQYSTDDKIVGAATVHGNGPQRRIVVGSHDERLHFVDAEGHATATYLTDGYLNSAAAVLGDRVVVGGCDGRLHVVGADGKQIAAWDIGTYVAASPAVVDGRAYVGHYAGFVVCIDLGTGAQVWRYGAGELPFFSSPAVDGTNVVIGGRDKCVHCIDRATGEGRWKFRTRGQVDGSPVICGSSVVVGSSDGRVYVLDLRSGERLWSYDVGAPILGEVAVAEGLMVVAAHDGVVYAFGLR